MCLLIESLKLKNNLLQNVAYHNHRLNYSRKKLFESSNDLDINSYVEVPDLNPKQIYKCRIEYEKEFYSYNFHVYIPRIIRTLKLVNCDDLEYQFKYADRKELDRIKNLHPEVDTIIFVKNGYITDCTFANLVFLEGKCWYTPRTVLLEGTKRQFYLDKGQIVATDIRVADLSKFTSVRLINAMMDLDESPDIAVQNIF